MNKSEFWHLIETSKQESGGNIDRQLKILFKKLCSLSEKELLEYDSIFSELFFQANTWELWAAAYIINQGCSDDGFMDFRGGLISQGEKVFTDALLNPESLVDVISFENGKLSLQSDWAAGPEEMLYLSQKAYEKKNKTDEMPRVIPSQTETTGTRWEEGKEGKVLPKLAQHCRKGRIKQTKKRPDKKTLEPNPEQLNFNFD